MLAKYMCGIHCRAHRLFYGTNVFSMYVNVTKKIVDKIGFR